MTDATKATNATNARNAAFQFLYERQREISEAKADAAKLNLVNLEYHTLKAERAERCEGEDEGTDSDDWEWETAKHLQDKYGIVFWPWYDLDEERFVEVTEPYPRIIGDEFCVITFLMDGMTVTHKVVGTDIKREGSKKWIHVPFVEDFYETGSKPFIYKLDMSRFNKDARPVDRVRMLDTNTLVTIVDTKGGMLITAEGMVLDLSDENTLWFVETRYPQYVDVSTRKRDLWDHM